MSCCGPRNAPDFDDEREGLSDADLARFGGDEIACPACGADVYADAPMCSRCGRALLDGETPAAGGVFGERGGVVIAVIAGIALASFLGVSLL